MNDDIKKYRLLSQIDSPADLRKIDESELGELCSELRQFIIEHLSNNPGHFASSMGAVEIAVALHYVFNTPQDRIVWDVGHQAYPHKILTGRKKQFPDMRKHGGISGFPNPNESEYDAFVAGHASNSISAALGMAIANLMTPGKEKDKVVAVIGDASIGGGLAFEGLNNASNYKNNLLIILNDNDMSIDDNVGALHRYLTKLTTSRRYNKWRYRLYNSLKSKNIINDKGRGVILRFNNSIKALISKQQNIFEGLNIRYFGPFDGNDISKVVQVLNDIKDMEGPRILHLHTVKGKGYAKAEEDPTTWHAPGKFDAQTGERLKKASAQDAPLWQEVFGHTLTELADTNDDIVGVTAAMPSGTSLSVMAKKYPDRVFDVGISEGHAVTFSGGLAAQKKKPFCVIYSSFLQRAYDSIIHDIAIQGLPVTFCIDRAGLVGEDGVTHHGQFDLAYMNIIPGMIVSSPMDEATLRNLMYTSQFIDKPFAIRYPRGKAVNHDWRSPFKQIEVGKGRCITDAETDVAVVSIGPLGNDVQRAVTELNSEGIRLAHYDMIFLKPIDEALLEVIASKHRHIITLEDGTVKGGLGSTVNDWLRHRNLSNKVTTLGINDIWVHHGSVEQLRTDCGYDYDSILSTIKHIVSKS
ncbi:MAG: 1-deoxy-D-xylulose-5-phosphate synthase [Muribaculaceae bacterium]|nr:1-deoxy-D-xylulose-5-phosphate synthase [Muribaculaceae bacterium]